VPAQKRLSTSRNPEEWNRKRRRDTRVTPTRRPIELRWVDRTEMAHLCLEFWLLEGIAPLRPALIRSRAIDDGTSQGAGWLPRRRARRPARQALIADAVEECILPMAG